MKRCLFYILICLLSLSVVGQDESINAEKKLADLASVTEMATGTGKTTGHVVSLIIQNDGSEPLVLDIGPFLIPSNGKKQGYLIPDSKVVSIQPDANQLVELYGYCTNVNLKPTDKDESLSSILNWAIPTGQHLPTQENWLVPEGFELNISQEFGDFPYKLTYPGIDRTFIYSIDFDKYPVAASDLMLLVHDQIEEQYQLMENLNTIRTPYSSDLERQKAALMQHTFWIYTSSLIGDSYKKEEFKSKMAEQFELLVGDQNNEILTEQFESGVDDFWAGFLKLAQAAKIFKVSTK